MEATPMPPYFIIKIGKEAQRLQKEYLTKHILANPGTVFMQREVQFGEITAIGSEAKEWMPMAEVGDYLLVNHFVSGKKSDNGYNFYLIGEDDDFNFYAVNGFEIPGERALAYAIAKGEEVIPTPQYIFLNVPQQEQDGNIADMSVSENGLIVPKERKKTRDEWVAIMKANMERVRQLARNIPSGVMEEIMAREDPERREKHEYALAEIKKLETINAKISADINKKKYEPFTVAAVNPDWNEYIASIYGEKIVEGDVVYFLNIASNYIINFSGTDFIVADVKYLGAPEKYLKKAIHDFKHHNATREKRTNKVRG